MIQCYGLKIICKIIYDTQQRYVWEYDPLHMYMRCCVCSKYASLHDELLLKVNQKFLEIQQPMSVEIFNCFYEVNICSTLLSYIMFVFSVDGMCSHKICHRWSFCEYWRCTCHSEPMYVLLMLCCTCIWYTQRQCCTCLSMFCSNLNYLLLFSLQVLTQNLQESRWRSRLNWIIQGCIGLVMPLSAPPCITGILTLDHLLEYLTPLGFLWPIAI